MGKQKKEETNSFVSGGHSEDEDNYKKGKKVENLLYSKFRGNKATMYGIEMIGMSIYYTSKTMAILN